MKKVKFTKIKGYEMKPMTEEQVQELKNATNAFEFTISTIDNKINENLVENSLKEKPVTNKVHPKLEGEYKLKIKGDKICLIKNDLYVSVRCHEEDDYKIGKGVEQCFSKIFEEINKPIMIGDTVKIVDNEDAYTTYTDWLYTYLHFNDIKNFQYDKMPKNGVVGEVIAIHNHLQLTNHVLMAIRTKEDKVYLMDMKGVVRKV